MIIDLELGRIVKDACIVFDYVSKEAVIYSDINAASKATKVRENHITKRCFKAKHGIEYKKRKTLAGYEFFFLKSVLTFKIDMLNIDVVKARKQRDKYLDDDFHGYFDRVKQKIKACAISRSKMLAEEKRVSKFLDSINDW